MNNEYYKTKKTVEEYIKLAENHNGIGHIEKLRKYLPTESELLEIGSGPGTDWNILNEYYNVTGSDNSLEFLKYLMKNNPDEMFFEIDAITLKTEQTYNGIYSNKVLHHLKNAELIKSINRQSEILKPNGIICHTFWKGEGTEIYNGLFVNYHTTDSLNKLFKKKFDILVLDKYKEFENEDSLLIIAKKKYSLI